MTERSRPRRKSAALASVRLACANIADTPSNASPKTTSVSERRPILGETVYVWDVNWGEQRFEEGKGQAQLQAPRMENLQSCFKMRNATPSISHTSNLGLPLGPSKETRRSPILAWHGLPKRLPKRTRFLKSRARRPRNPKQAPKLVLEARATRRGHKSPMTNKMMRALQVLHRSRRRRRSRKRGAPRRTREKLVLRAKRVQQHQGENESVQNKLFGSTHSADEIVLVGAS